MTQTSTERGVASQVSLETVEELLFWNKQVLQYLALKRLSISLNDEEQRLLTGTKAAVDRVSF